MIAAGKPPRETERLATLAALHVLDTPPERPYDDLALLAARICGSSIAFLSFVDAERVKTKAAVGLELAEWARGEAPCSHAILQSDPLVVADLSADPRFADSPLVTGGPQLRFYAGVPLVTGAGLVLGTLCAADRTPKQLRDDQLEALSALGRQTVAQLELRRLVDRQQRQALTDLSNRRNAVTVDQAHEVLVRLLDEREPELLARHQEVADLSVRVGRRLGIGGEELDVLRRAAELHDIGKIAIPDAILHKPGALSEEEWGFILDHPLLGERILAAAPALRPVGALVRSTHESWDGQGYPDGLAGDAIPLGAHIICACDALKAMTSSRPYRRSRGVEEALVELRRCAGAQFDPAVIEVLSDEVESARVSRGGEATARA